MLVGDSMADARAVNLLSLSVVVWLATDFPAQMRCHLSRIVILFHLGKEKREEKKTVM